MQISRSVTSIQWQADSEAARDAERDQWQVVDQVAALELGGAANTERLRTLADAGSAILEQLATRDHPAHDVDAALADASGAWLGTTTGGVRARMSPPLQATDLASVDSRYIGETEKNLDSRFADAPGGAADLAFDEGDALFGKRSDVRDAHDRSAHQTVLHAAGCACDACQRR